MREMRITQRHGVIPALVARLEGRCAERGWSVGPVGLGGPRGSEVAAWRTSEQRRSGAGKKEGGDTINF